MYMPVWGMLLILALCLLVLWTAGYKYVDIFISNYPDLHPVKAYLALFALLLLMVLSVWLGYEAVSFNRKHGV